MIRLVEVLAALVAASLLAALYFAKSSTAADQQELARLEAELARDEVVLVVDDEPVEKWAFADWLAEACGVDYPPKRTKAERLKDGDLSETARRRIQTSKRCSNERLRSLGYEFVHPTFRSGYRAAIEAYGAPP